jgi:hypothetical protein
LSARRRAERHVTQPATDGFATAYACGQNPPDASNVNFIADQTVPNLVIAKPGEGGRVCIVTSAPAHLVADLEGWFPPGSYDPLPAPTRVLDTRTGAGRKVAAGVETRIIDDQGPADIVANVTVTEPDGPGFLTIYPCGTSLPVASNINFAHGEVVANLTIEQPGSSGGVCSVHHLDPSRRGRAGTPPAGQWIHLHPAAANRRHPLGARRSGGGSRAGASDDGAVLSCHERHRRCGRHGRRQRDRHRLSLEWLPHCVSVWGTHYGIKPQHRPRRLAGELGHHTCGRRRHDLPDRRCLYERRGRSAGMVPR